MWLILLACAIVGYVMYKALMLYTADGDLTVLASKMNPSYFQDRVVWITGASSGIGEEMCRQLSKMGSKLILSSRNEEKLEKVKEGLAHPENARVLPIDLSDPEATRAATKKAKGLFGKIDILVNNAGVSTRALFVDLQEQVHRKVMELDFFAPWILTHDTLPGMIKEGFGHVINVSSIWGKAGPSNRSSYSSAKFAIIGLMDCVRNETQSYNVHVTNVIPGPVITMAGVNALKADGTKFGTSDSLIASGMTVERCVELTLIAVSNQQREVWVSPQPWLMLPYLSHYYPSLLNYILAKRGREEIEAAKKAQ